MYILGISCYYHDASAALLKDEKIVAAAEEERFTRIKHDTSFPINAITFCLESEGIAIKDIDHIVYYEKPLLKFERLLAQHIEMFPWGWWNFTKALPSWINEKLRVPGTIRKKLKYDRDVFFIDHHTSHAAASFLPSPFEKAAIFTVDGVGEWTTTTLGKGEGNEIILLKKIDFPHSLGLLYSTITAFLGFKVNNSEYKVMGLSAYGKPNYVKQLKKMIDIREDGSFQLNMKYFVYHYRERMPSHHMDKLLGKRRISGEPVLQRHKDIARSLQVVTEEALFKGLNHLYTITKCDNLCIGGGVALNSLANGKILKHTPFKQVYSISAPGDGGTSLGAACYLYHTLLRKRRSHVLKHAYLGPEYSDAQIEHFLKKHKISYTSFPNKQTMIKEVAELIWKNKVVGWFQGKMEFGPRALGNRSILSNPCNPKMQEILNLKVKHREAFRPFAPVILAEKAHDWFLIDEPLPLLTDFMLMVYPIKKEKQKIIPAVTHVDGTGRLQTIRREENNDYYDLILEFEKKSKVPILINTSFNIRGEPIVLSPYHAYRCMMGTEIDYLAIGSYLIKRKDNLKHAWDSETEARD